MEHPFIIVFITSLIATLLIAFDMRNENRHWKKRKKR